MKKRRKKTTAELKEAVFDVTVIPTLAACGYLLTREHSHPFDFSLESELIWKITMGWKSTLNRYMRKKSILRQFANGYEMANILCFYFISKEDAEYAASILKNETINSRIPDIQHVTHNIGISKTDAIGLYKKIKKKNAIKKGEEAGISASSLLMEATSKSNLHLLRSLGWEINFSNFGSQFTGYETYIIDFPSWCIKSKQLSHIWEKLNTIDLHYFATDSDGNTMYFYLTQDECSQAFERLDKLIKKTYKDSIRQVIKTKVGEYSVLYSNQNIFTVEHGQADVHITSPELDILCTNLIEVLNIEPDEELGIRAGGSIFESELSEFDKAVGILKALNIEVKTLKPIPNNLGVASLPDEIYRILVPCAEIAITIDDVTTRNMRYKFTPRQPTFTPNQQAFMKRVNRYYYIDKDEAREDLDNYKKQYGLTEEHYKSELFSIVELLDPKDNEHIATFKFKNNIPRVSKEGVIWAAKQLTNPDLSSQIDQDKIMGSLFEGRTPNKKTTPEMIHFLQGMGYKVNDKTTNKFWVIGNFYAVYLDWDIPHKFFSSGFYTWVSKSAQRGRHTYYADKETMMLDVDAYMRANPEMITKTEDSHATWIETKEKDPTDRSILFDFEENHEIEITEPVLTKLYHAIVKKLETDSEDISEIEVVGQVLEEEDFIVKKLTNFMKGLGYDVDPISNGYWLSGKFWVVHLTVDNFVHIFKHGISEKYTPSDNSTRFYYFDKKEMMKDLTEYMKTFPRDYYSGNSIIDPDDGEFNVTWTYGKVHIPVDLETLMKAHNQLYVFSDSDPEDAEGLEAIGQVLETEDLSTEPVYEV